jgi:regulator of sigma E protease
MMDIVYSILSFFIVISIIVVTHELGHYAMARVFGIKVTDFAVGWGPTLFSVKDKHGTAWKLCAIPIGGYIKYLGDEDMTSLKSNKNLSKKDRAYSLAAQSPIKKSLIAVAGPLSNFLFAILIFTYFFSVSGKIVSDNEITMVDKGSVAHKEGLQIGDRIKSIEGSSVADFSDVERYVRSNPNIPLKVEIERDGQITMKLITPESVEIKNGGETVVLGKLGIGSNKVRREVYSVPKAFVVSVNETVKITCFTLKTIGQMITGSRGTKEMASVIRISQYSGKFIKQGAAAFMWFIAMLSINLGLVNLFPIPPLDGGHILLHGVRGLVGDKWANYFENYAIKIGVAILIALMAFTIVNDIIHLS